MPFILLQVSNCLCFFFALDFDHIFVFGKKAAIVCSSSAPTCVFGPFMFPKASPWDFMTSCFYLDLNVLV
jgi:hypothetical protein